MTSTDSKDNKTKSQRRTNYRVSVIGTPPADIAERISALHAVALSSRGLGQAANTGSKGPRSP